MLNYVVLAAALALALACPCPPAPATAEVCGSDLVTYPSLCHLQCAAESGLSLKHTGPCSATEELMRWTGCSVTCEDADCGCGGEDDSDCNIMCGVNCICGCYRYPRGGMDHGLWEECFNRRRCEEKMSKCMERCREEECRHKCWLHYNKCGCECALQARPAPQRKGNWTACLKRDQCHSRTCSECRGDDPSCPERCEKRCRCECAGWTRRDLSGEWEECFIGTQTCEQAHSACVRECGDQDDCKDKCYMDLLDCKCECRTAKGEEWRLWGECKMNSMCEFKTCKECQDTECADRCRRNCECRCLGINIGINEDSLDDEPFQQCKLERKCGANREDCLARCKTSKRTDCKLSCNLDFEKCYCECARGRPPKRVEIIQHCNFIN